MKLQTQQETGRGPVGWLPDEIGEIRMKRYLGIGLTVAALIASLSALAQDTTTVVTPDQTTVVNDNGSVATYPTTGWDPSMLMAASGALAAGSLGLKGFLRKRA